MDNTIAYFGLKDEDDYMYKKAEAKAETRLAAQQAEAERRLRFTVIRLIETTSLTEDQIIKACDVLPEFVQNIKMDLAAATKKIARLKKTMSAEKIAQRLDLPMNWVEKQMQQM